MGTALDRSEGSGFAHACADRRPGPGPEQEGGYEARSPEGPQLGEKPQGEG